MKHGNLKVSQLLRYAQGESLAKALGVRGWQQEEKPWALDQDSSQFQIRIVRDPCGAAKQLTTGWLLWSGEDGLIRDSARLERSSEFETAVWQGFEGRAQVLIVGGLPIRAWRAKLYDSLQSNDRNPLAIKSDRWNTDQAYEWFQAQAWRAGAPPTLSIEIELKSLFGSWKSVGRFKLNLGSMEIIPWQGSL